MHSSTYFHFRYLGTITGCVPTFFLANNGLYYGQSDLHDTSTKIFTFSTAHSLPQTYISPKVLPRTIVHGHISHVRGGNTQRGEWYLQRIQPLTMQKVFNLSHLFLKTTCFRNTTSESPLIASYSPFSVCTKVSKNLLDYIHNIPLHFLKYPLTSTSPQNT